MKKIGIVGVGAIAQAYLHAFVDPAVGRIEAVADTRADAAAAAAEAVKCRAFATFKEMAENCDLDGIILCTPPVTHPEIATYFLERGIPVLCEKPLAISEEGAEEIVAASRKSGTLMTMASKFRYVEDVIRLKSIITSGLLGDILRLENVFASPVDMSTRWNSQAEISGGGVLMDNGAHSADIVRYLVGPIREVLAINSTCSRNLQVEDNATLIARTDSGVEAHIDLSWTFDKQLPHFVSVYGTQGTAHVGWRQSKYKQRSSSDWIVFGNGYNKIEAFVRKVSNFCNAIDHREQPLVTAADALASVRVIKAAYASAESNAWVNVARDVVIDIPKRAVAGE